MRNILVTGGAGFIGSAVVRHLVDKRFRVITLDKLTYAGSMASLRQVMRDTNHRFVRGDIADRALVGRLLVEEDIDGVMHLAAETHVDRSIDNPAAFVEANVAGTVALLATTLSYWRSLPAARRDRFRFHHVSTDEVYGDLPLDAGVFTEETRYAPSSPYSASKAASDHFVRAWHRTFELPVVVSNSSNNYGPFQFPEKLIPLITISALEGKQLPVYGKGENVRDWLLVEDHAAALELVLTRGRIGQTYNIGGSEERANIAVVEAICDRLDAIAPLADGTRRRSLISFVADRPGHDRRYAMDTSKIESDLGWLPSCTFEQGLDRTIRWYVSNSWWWKQIATNAGERLGTYG